MMTASRIPWVGARAFALGAVLGGGLVAQQPARPDTDPAAAIAPPLAPPLPVEREFRGVWIATVANIDWPSRPGLSTAAQQRELVALFDRASALHLNAVIFQIRPAADALYQSAFEPWSEYLTGRQGVAPAPYYDPLAFAITEAHKRGIELHAWFNPYRARHPSAISAAAASHISRRHPELIRHYGRNQLWMDPGEPAVRRHTLRVILDVVARYDIDGVHIDDYFYPYPEPDRHGRDRPFPDDHSWRRYRRAGGHLGRDDWRRANVNTFVRELYVAVKKAKPWVRVGISPFGIWRPGSPPSVRGFDAYAKLYADSRKWLTEGWLDYLAPQLYWPVAARDQGYSQLLEWWTSQNVRNRHIYAGNYAGRVADAARGGWRAQELLDQIAITRVARGAAGNVYFSMGAFMASRDSLVERLTRGAYAAPALVPASLWLPTVGIPLPAATAKFDPITGVTTVTLGSPGHASRLPASAPLRGGSVWLWVVQAKLDTAWTTAVVPGSETTYSLLSLTPAPPMGIAVTAVDRLGNASPARMLSPAAIATLPAAPPTRGGASAPPSPSPGRGPTR